MKQKPFVSIIVPVYNSKKTIDSCVSSLLKINYPEDRYEVFLVKQIKNEYFPIILF